MARAQGARSTLAGAFESTYGTAPESGFLTLPFIRNGLSGTQALLENDLLGQGRDPLAPDLDSEAIAGDIEVPMDVEATGYWLKGALGAPTTTGSSTYTHVFESGGWTLPSMALEKGMPDVPSFDMAAGVKVNRIVFGQQRNGRANMTVGLLGQSEALDTTTQAGTPTAYDHSRFMQRHGKITRGGSDLGDIVSAEFTYSNNLDMIETVTEGGLIAGLDPSMTSLSGRLVARFSSTTLLTQATNGTAAAFTFEFTKGSDSLTFAVPKVYLPKPGREISGPQGIQVTFEWQAAQDDDGDPMLTATLINSVATY